MSYSLEGKTVLVTGGTGSFGQAFVSRLLRQHKPGKVIIFSRDEQKQYEMKERPIFRDAPNLRFFIGDVRDLDRMVMAFRSVHVVIHAAALKHVTAAEYNPFECIRTNVHGAENVVTASIRAGVERVIALSTDKAASPINLYGASKLASDKIFVAAKWLVGGETKPLFGVVRYGNVLGSRGSVVPMFRRLIAEGAKDLPITDRRMSRFWITLTQGVDFVLSCLPLMQGGEIFVPKIPSMKVVDLADVMSPGIAIRDVGIRPGEKLHEVLLTEDDARLSLDLPDRYIIRPALYGAQRQYHAQEKAVAEGFHYSSDNNTDWLDRTRTIALLQQLDLDHQ